jgi:hypothetical protein
MVELPAGLGVNAWAAADVASVRVYAFLWRQHSPYLTPSGATASDATQKILWQVEGTPASAVEVVAHPAANAEPRVDVGTFASAYPSTIDLPTAGCWVFDVAVAGQTATIGLLVGP